MGHYLAHGPDIYCDSTLWRSSVIRYQGVLSDLRSRGGMLSE
jgi:hypothetical protein